MPSSRKKVAANGGKSPPGAYPLMPGRLYRALIVACMTANGRLPSSANASPRQTTRVPARPDHLADDRELLPGRGREQVDRVRRGQHGRLRRHDGVGGVPARGVQHRGDRPGVQEPVLLGEPVVMPQRYLDASRLDGDHLHAERGHHALPVEAGPDPRPHGLGGLGLRLAAFGFRHQLIVSERLLGWLRPVPAVTAPSTGPQGRGGQDPGDAPPPPRHLRGQQAKLRVGAPLLGRGLDPLRLVLPGHVDKHHRGHVLAFSPAFWSPIRRTGTAAMDRLSIRGRRRGPRRPRASAPTAAAHA
jgi:hypothetical protein